MAELGRKITCTECGIKFYDLGRVDVVCPKCGHVPAPADDGPALKRSTRRSSRTVESNASDEPEEVGGELDESEGGDVDVDTEVDDDLDIEDNDDEDDDDEDDDED